MSRLDVIRSRIAPARARLLAHPLYARMASLDDVRVFMRSHVFAVWDFMSLLKRLQRDLTCVTVPWVPVGDAEVRFLINEIVCGEESDVDPRGGRIAHFDLYLRAMHEAGSDTSAVDKALASVRAGGSTAAALVSAGVSAGAAAFSGATFAQATNGKSHEVAAAFTFGREDLIPDMFTELVTRLSREYPANSTPSVITSSDTSRSTAATTARSLSGWSSCSAVTMTASGPKPPRPPSPSSRHASPSGRRSCRP
jgi:hypothetical protein